MTMDWAWLTATLVQALGISIALATLGFAYERAIRERFSLPAALAQNHSLAWFSLGALFLAGGMLFSEASWLQKAASIALAASLIWLNRIGPAK